MPRKIPQSRWLRLSLLAVAIVFLLALVSRTLPRERAARGLPTQNAQWIWKPLTRKDQAPTVFYAIRDFELDSLPARARLLVTADEAYVLTLNGKRIGIGAYQPGAALDVYEVGPLLIQGGNRLLVELRSGRGAGGLLLSLQDAATGRQLTASDERWRLFPRAELGLARGWLPIGDGQPAFCWGYPPIGRWGRPTVGRPRPLLTDHPRPLLPAAAMLPLRLDLGAAGRTRPPGSPVLYDWGRTVEGYLTFTLPAGREVGAALLFTGGDRPPDPLRAKPSGSVLIPPGKRDWMDSRPRRFRYAMVVGLVRPAAAAVLPAPVETVRASHQTAPEGETRVFGVAGPPLRTPVEDEVWSKLQRVPGVARGKEL